MVSFEMIALYIQHNGEPEKKTEHQQGHIETDQEAWLCPTITQSILSKIDIINIIISEFPSSITIKI